MQVSVTIVDNKAPREAPVCDQCGRDGPGATLPAHDVCRQVPGGAIPSAPAHYGDQPAVSDVASRLI